MNLEQRKRAFVKCGLFIKRHFSDPDSNRGWDEKERPLHEGLNQLIVGAKVYNGWFIKEFVEEALVNISCLLDERSLSNFTENIDLISKLIN